MSLSCLCAFVKLNKTLLTYLLSKINQIKQFVIEDSHTAKGNHMESHKVTQEFTLTTEPPEPLLQAEALFYR